MIDPRPLTDRVLACHRRHRDALEQTVGGLHSVSVGNRVDLRRDKAGVTITAVLSYLRGGHVELLMLLETHLKGREVMFEVCKVCVGGQQTVSAENTRGRLLFGCKQGYQVRLRSCLTR